VGLSARTSAAMIPIAGPREPIAGSREPITGPREPIAGPREEVPGAVIASARRAEAILGSRDAAVGPAGRTPGPGKAIVRPGRAIVRPGKAIAAGANVTVAVATVTAAEASLQHGLLRKWAYDRLHALPFRSLPQTSSLHAFMSSPSPRPCVSRDAGSILAAARNGLAIASGPDNKAAWGDRFGLVCRRRDDLVGARSHRR
jgi:hypothetical protein